MILSIVIGYVVGRLVQHRYGAPLIVLAAGLIVGVLSGFWFVPLMYPLLVVEGTGVIIPENLELVLCFLVPEVVLYTDVVLREFSLSISILFTMIGASVLGTLSGWWTGRVPKMPSKAWEEQE